MQITRRIQDWYDEVSITGIPEREIACFSKALAGYEAAEAVLVTNDHEEVIETCGTKIHCIPAVKFLLGLP